MKCYSEIYQSCQSAFLTFASKSCWPFLWSQWTMWREINSFSDLNTEKKKRKQWKLKWPPSGRGLIIVPLNKICVYIADPLDMLEWIICKKKFHEMVGYVFVKFTLIKVRWLNIIITTFHLLYSLSRSTCLNADKSDMNIQIWRGI